MAYDWPTQPFNNVKKRHLVLSTFGEFRGQGSGDGIAFLHSGFDIPETGRRLEVYSPDVGLVRRFGAAANGNPSAGERGPIRVGHFAFNHITSILAKPGRAGMPEDLKIYVVEKGAGIFLMDKSAVKAENKRLKAKAKKAKTKKAKAKFVPITTVGQLTDALVKPAKVEGKPRIGLRKIAKDMYERVTFYPRTLPIGLGVGPTDLHIVYYDTADGPVTDRGNLRNPLPVMKNYANKKRPGIGEVSLNANDKAEKRILLLKKVGDSGIFTADMKGANFKALAFSDFAQVCGVYQLEYEICNDKGQTSGRSRMWKFDELPSDADSKLIVDENLSFFPGAKAFDKKTIKKTVYRFTRSVGGVISDRNHFELEDVVKWSDGSYTLLIWLQNIAKSNGIGVAPSVNEVKYCFGFSVKTVGKVSRKITVTKAPIIVEVDGKAVTFVDGKMVFKTEDDKDGTKKKVGTKKFKFESRSAEVLKRVGGLEEFVPKAAVARARLISDQ